MTSIVVHPIGPHRFRHRKRGSIYVLVGGAEMCCSLETTEGSELDVWRRKSDGDLIVDPLLVQLDAREWVGLAELQTAQPLGPGVHMLTFYRGEADDRLWLRPTAEFYDGRFEEISQ